MVAVAVLGGAGCGWNSSCGRFYIVEDTSCDDDPALYRQSHGPLAPCGRSSLTCAPLTECLPSTVPFAEAEPLCTQRCQRDADCASTSRAARCVGAAGQRLCHATCLDDSHCSSLERCVSAADGGGRVCAPFPQRYRSCWSAPAPCATGLTCAPFPDADRLCTFAGCTRNEDCPDHGEQPVACVASPGGSFCALGCQRDEDCYARGTRCVREEGLTALSDFGVRVGACLAR